MTAPLTSPTFVPMGFAAQVKALQGQTQQQAERIVALEKESAIKEEENQIIKTQLHEVLNRIDALEQRNAYLTGRRTEAVSQLLNQRTLHTEAANAFVLRTADIQTDDFEGMVTAYGNTVTAVLNHHQGVLRNFRPMHLGHFAAAYGVAGPSQHANYLPQPIGYAYPLAYKQDGYCHVHNRAYPCRICGH